MRFYLFWGFVDLFKIDLEMSIENKEKIRSMMSGS